MRNHGNYTTLRGQILDVKIKVVAIGERRTLCENVYIHQLVLLRSCSERVSFRTLLALLALGP